MENLWGYFLQPEICLASLAAMIAALVIVGYFGMPFFVWTLFGAVALVGYGAPPLVLWVFLGVCAAFIVKPVRRFTVSNLVFKTMKALKLIPHISQTERTALEAGVVWMEAELFSGKPNFKTLMKQPYHKLSAEEQSFLDNETEQLCKMIDDWKIWKTRELQPEVWDYIRKKGFLGMIIPKEYGGRGFSHSAHSAVVQKISTRSIAMCIYVMVPNSLGPAELLVHYGTDAQKKKYLPNLANGTDIPCFGLTELNAGSDAGSLVSEGVLFKGPDGQIHVRLNWKKRWITLAAISTLIGLAFRLRDPENLLGRGEDLGITCGLIPSDTKGVVIGRRHNPIYVPFHNCPTEGHDVVLKAEDCIIGGLKEAGNGWKMLMECLGAGRGISLPGQAAGGSKMVSRLVSCHATIRKQFGLSIGKFEGVEEPLARIAGATYYLEALRKYVLSALDQHIAPPVVTAIIKYTATEEGRKVMADGMDVMGGAGISCGPRNQIAHTYIGIPISITVEGANILTRTLMVFGQGALRAHPYAFKEVNAIERGDLAGFDNAFWGHVGHIVRNLFRTVVLSVTRAHFACTGLKKPSHRYAQKLAWISASFALMADLAMGGLGGKLKAREKLTGRFADILSWMFLATATLKRFEEEGRKPEDKILLDFSMAVTFQKIQDAFDGIFANFDIPGVHWFFKGPVRWWSRFNFVGLAPTDRLTHRVADALLNNQEQRERLCYGMYMPLDKDEQFGRLEHAYQTIRQAEAVEKKVRKAASKKIINKKSKTLWDDALKAQVITEQEHALAKEAERLRLDAIQVDDFSEEEYVSNRV